MAVNKVIYGGNTLVDLTGDTVTAADLADGVKATNAAGEPIVGLMQKVTIDAELSPTSTNPVQNKVITEAIANMGGGSGGVSTSEPNKWLAEQEFRFLKVVNEKYITYIINGTSNTPLTATMAYVATGAFTLDLSTLTRRLSAGESSIFTAYFSAKGDYPLTITNAGTLKYIGSASDVAITSAGMLLNVLMTKDANGNLTSIVQASKLS